ncbi:hypothetical protein GUITHDRAFT_103750 [Guillardia theta CCMP2712]|uniref:Fe2OG dioxygenase domain-containing protein n=1 Tax=Guillardia theta (strain CCMP2712) TaxID=905079 RepID=L1JR02_GUITC|nr:hypothetical protein GUITHDRAFT_103750 [Guillardia theta CCMP2712]EKX50518.1 hypothetical protein GUITHDRAFT_103750 [Guillardia theta CCMP2712]|eukprot:XP_005837498.1 hypothetical protein GUITHDRAFT_103750 [Guillardia theta CCMP2712]
MSAANFKTTSLSEPSSSQRRETEAKRLRACVNALVKVSFSLTGNAASEVRQEILQDEKFYSLCHSISAIRLGEQSTKVVDDARISLQALRALAVLAPLPDTLSSCVQTLAGRVCERLENLSSSDKATFDWACRRLHVDERVQRLAGEAFKELALPFSISIGDSAGILEDVASFEELRKEIPFKAEKLLTRDGRQVLERRETCWMAEEGIGGLAYSGKIMSPTPFTPAVTRVRDVLFERTNVRYDCCLINLYPDGDSACKWHTDPDHGRLWSLEATSFGETRRFNLRRIPEPKSRQEEEEEEKFSFHVFEGDTMHMFRDCQDTFEHCVLKAEGEHNLGPRISIVFKKALISPSGKSF